MHELRKNRSLINWSVHELWKKENRGTYFIIRIPL